MSDHFIRIPPDSTGKKIRNSKKVDVGLTSINVTNLNLIPFDGIVYGATSGAFAYFNSYDTLLDGTTIIFLSHNTGTFNVNETLTYSGLTLGVVSSLDELYTQLSTIVDGTNPTHVSKIDETGAMYMRFRDGNISLDSFGNIITSEISVMKSYSFTYDSLNYLDFFNRTAVGGSMIEDGTDSVCKLTTTTASGSTSQKTTILYFPYLSLQSNVAVYSIAVGDVGKTGVVRRWGAYDDDDGVYFELNGTEFSVNIKSSITNTVNKVVQSDFNGVKLNNSLIDEFVLDVSKFNLYWVSYQWHGVGVVKFGVYNRNGEKILLHTFKNPNTNIVPYIRRGSLPSRIEQFNTSLVASSSELKCSNIVVARENSEIKFNSREKVYTSPEYVTVKNTRTPLLSLRLPSTINGFKNRTLIMASGFEFMVSGHPIVVEFIVNGDLSGESFVLNPLISNLNEYDVSATGITNGYLRESSIYPVGFYSNVIEENVNSTVINDVDGNSTTITLCARSLSPGNDASVFFIVRWKEII